MRNRFFKWTSLILVLSMLLPVFGLAEALPVENEAVYSSEPALQAGDDVTFDSENSAEGVLVEEIEGLEDEEQALALEDGELILDEVIDLEGESAGDEAQGEEGPEIEFEEAPEDESAEGEESMAKNAIPKKLALGVGEKYTLKYSGATFKSSNPAVAAVSNKGVITAKKAGAAAITVKAKGKTVGTCKVTVQKAPTSIKLNPIKLKLSVGKTKQVKVTLPKGTASQITWTSNKKKVATVSEKGVITAVGKGTAKITAKTFNGKKASVVVNVDTNPWSLSFETKTLSIGLKESVTVKPIVNKGARATYTWQSKNPKIAKVSKTGKITGLKKGTTTITVTTQNKLKATLKVKVLAAPSSLSLNYTTGHVEVGETLKLKAKLPGGTASQIKWVSSNANVAKVDKKGVVTGVSSGTAIIKAKTFNGKTATCEVTVGEIPQTLEISGSRAKAALGETWQMSAMLTPSGVGAQVSWASSNETVLYVSGDGQATAVGGGVATITAVTADGMFATCDTIVTLPSDNDFVMSDGVITGYTGAGGNIIVPKTDYQGNIIVGIGDCAFQGNATITGITLCETLTSIGYEAFKDCSGLTELYIPRNVSYIGWDAFDPTLKLLCTLDSYAYYYAINRDQPVQLLGNYDVADVSKEGNTVSALVVSSAYCTLVMEVWNDEQDYTLDRQTLMVSGSDDPQTVSFDLSGLSDMPEYFVLKLYFQDGYGNEIGTPLVCMDYTRAYAQFRAKTPDDFRGDKIMDAQADGFAVLNDEVKEVPGIEEGDGFRIASNTDVNIGDVFYISTIENFVKVGSVDENEDGTFSVTMADNATITDFYKYIRYDTTFDMVQTLANHGLLDRNSVVAPNVSFHYGGTSSTYRYEKEVSVTGTNGAKATGTVSAGAKVVFDLYVDAELFGDQYYSTKTYVDLDGSASLELSTAGETGNRTRGEISHEIPIFKKDVPTELPGVFIGVDLKAPLKIGVEATASLTVPFDAKVGFRYQTGNGLHGIMEPHLGQPTLKVQGKLTASIGLELEVGVEATPARILFVGLDGEAGVRITATTAIVDIEAGNEPEVKHDCTLCFDVDMELYIEVKAKVTLQLGQNYKMDLLSGNDWSDGGAPVGLPTKTWPLFKGYISVVNSPDSVHGGQFAMGKGECPNHSYRTRVKTLDQYGNELTGLQVTVSRVNPDTGEQTQVASGDSLFTTYLYAGVYVAQADIDGETVVKAFIIENSAVNVKLMPDAKGWISGRVSDAASGDGIVGATVACGDASTTTNEYGEYTLQVPADDVQVSFSASEYITQYVTVSVPPMETVYNVNAALSKNIEGAVRVVLTWGATPSDLDSHLTWANGHVYYADKEIGEAMLDVDDTTSYGPETVTFVPQPGVTYTYYVHDYSNGDNPASFEMGNSGAQVDIYLSDGTHVTRRVPRSRGIKWVVFSYRDGEISYSDVVGNSADAEKVKLPRKDY